MTAVAATRARALVAPSSLRALRALAVRLVREQARAPRPGGGALGAMGALMAAMWPSIEPSIDRLLESYPEGLRTAFGIDRLDTVEKYVDAEMLSLIVPFALVFFAVRCVTRATVGAEDEGHLDTLLSLPVARWVLTIASFVATGVLAGAILAVLWAATWVAGTIAGTGISASKLASGVFDVWPLTMCFAGLAALAGGALRRRTVVTAVTAGTLVAMYVLDLVGKLADVPALRAVSAFRYYGSAIQDGFDISHAVALVLIGVALACLGGALFERRDIR